MTVSNRVNHLAMISKRIWTRFNSFKRNQVKINRDRRKLPGESVSMVAVIERILDEKRKLKQPPFSYGWIRNN